MRAVNLLPREESRQGKQLALTPQNTPILVGAGLGVVVLGALALGYSHESGAVASAQKDLQVKKVELASTPKPPPPTAVQVDPNAQLTGQQAARMAAVTTALGARFAWDRVFREFAQVLPDDVWLSSLSFQTPTVDAAASAGAAAPTGITIVGTTYSHDSVARLLARLALIPELSNVSLQSDASSAAGAAAGSTGTPTPAAGSAAGTVTFTITASVNLPPGATSLTPAPPPPPPVPTSTDTGSTS
jgi:Fimbrial assembly protein (PilN)